MNKPETDDKVHSSSDGQQRLRTWSGATISTGDPINSGRHDGKATRCQKHPASLFNVSSTYHLPISEQMMPSMRKMTYPMSSLNLAPSLERSGHRPQPRMSHQNAPRSSLTSPQLITHGPTTGIPRQSYAFGKPPALDYHACPAKHHINIVDADVQGGRGR